MDWLNENALRSYPFVDGTPLDAYPTAIVDAVFTLGPDIPFDFDDDSAALQLTAVTVDAAGHHLTFAYVTSAGLYGAALVFTVPPWTPRHAVIRASSGQSHGYLTVGDIGALPAGTYSAAVEPRTLTQAFGASSATLRIYNAERRQSWLPYVPQAPGLTPTQVYTQTKAAAPKWAPNVCLSGPVGTFANAQIPVVAGFNDDVSADLLSATITISMDLNKSGSGCAIKGYVQNQLGSTDPVADINGDGIVDQADVTASDKLALTPKEISVQGVLRAINGVPAVGGDIRLTAGAGAKLTPSPETNTVLLTLVALSLPSSCVP